MIWFLRQYQAEKSGSGTLTITLNGADIKGSPFDLRFGTALELGNTPGYGVLSAVRSYIKDLGPDASAIKAGTTSTLLIQSVDSVTPNGFDMTRGGHKCEVALEKSGRAQQFQCTDNNNGQYSAVISNVTVSGRYTFVVKLGGAKIAGKPPRIQNAFEIDVTASEVSREQSQIHVTNSGTAGQDGTFVLEAKDAFGNLKFVKDDVLVSLAGPATTTNVRVLDNFNGIYTVLYRVTASGEYSIRCDVSSVQLRPASLTVLPGTVSLFTSVAEGSGLSQALAGEQAEFRLLIRDVFGNSQQAAGINVYTRPRNTTFTSSVQSVVGASQQITLSYLPTVSGEYELHILFGRQAMTGSPWTVNVMAGFLTAANCLIDGKGMREATAGDLATFVISARDQYSNPLTYGGFSFVVVTHDAKTRRRQSCTDMDTGKFDCTYRTTSIGELMLYVTHSSLHVKGSPFTVPVLPNSFDAQSSLVQGSSMSVATAGLHSVLVMIARDRFGNYLATGFENFIVSIAAEKESMAEYDLTDYQNGTYTIRYRTTRSGNYLIQILYQDTPVAGSPYALSVVASKVSATTSKILFPTGYACAGSTGYCGRVSQAFPVVLNLQDIYGNLQYKPTHVVASFGMEHKGVKTVLFEGFAANGQVPLTFVGTFAAAYKLSVSVEAQSMPDEWVKLSPLVFSENGFFGANGNGLSVATAGKEAQFTISTRDVFGNKVTTQLMPSFQVNARNEWEQEVALRTRILPRVEGSEWDVHVQMNQSATVFLELEAMNTHVAGMPYRVIVRSSTLLESMSTAEGPGIKAGLHSRETWFYVKPRDKYGNLAAQNLDASSFDLLVLHPDGSPQYPTINWDGSEWVGKYSPISVGSSDFKLYVRINLIHIMGSPFSVEMRSNPSSTVSATASIARGKAIQLSTAGYTSFFTVQAADQYGVYHTTSVARYKFTGEIVMEDYFDRLEPQDKGDGTFIFQYTVTKAGRYVLAVLLSGDDGTQTHISGSPFDVRIVPAASSAQSSRLEGGGLTRVVAGQEGSFTIEARDRYGNLQVYRPSASVPFGVVLTGPSNRVCSIQDFRDSSFVAIYNVTVSGTYAITITGPSDTASHMLLVSPAEYWAGTSYIDAKLLTITAGATAQVKVNIRDLYSNVVAAPATESEITSILCSVSLVGPVSVIAKDGNFLLVMNLTISGRYQMDVSIGSSAISSSPHSLVISAGTFSAAASVVSGAGLVDLTADRASIIRLSPRDALGNAVDVFVGDVSVSVTSLSPPPSLPPCMLPVNDTVKVSITKDGSTFTINYTASQPCEACNLSIQVRGQHVKGSPLVVTINPAEPPRMLTAMFASHLAGLQVTFDQPTDEGGCQRQLVGFFDCKEILEPQTLLMTGNNSKCSWSSSINFTVLFGRGATLALNSRLGIRQDTVRSARRNSRYASGTVTVLLPSNAMKPEPIIDGPGKISSCDNLTMDASTSYGDGTRGMRFDWGLELGPRNREVIINILTALPRSQSIVTIPSSVLVSDVEYVFTLTVTNFVEEKKTSVFRVYVGSTDTPRVMIVGQAKRLTKRTNPVQLRGEAALSTCASAGSKNIDFLWTQISGPKIEPWPAESIRTTSSLYLPRNILVAGETYTLRLGAVLDSNAKGFSFADVTLEVMDTPILAVLDGGDRTHAASLDLRLDASQSVDPDSRVQPFSFLWSCSPGPCFNDLRGLLAGSDAVVVIPGGTLAPGDYVFSVLVSKDPGPRTSEASVRITVMGSAVSAVGVSLNGIASLKVKPGERVVLTGTVRSGTPSSNTPCTPSYRWTLVEGKADLQDPSVRSTGLVSPNLALTGQALVRGQTYVLELSGKCVSEETGYSRVTVQVDQGPVGGYFKAAPTSGIALKTVFSMECNHWIDELENLPLSYVYQAALWDQTQPLSAKIASYKLDIILSPTTKAGENNETVGLNAIICNAFGSCVSSQATEILLKEDLAPPAVTDQLRLVSLAQGVGNYEMIVGASRAILDQVNVNRRRRAGRRQNPGQEVALRQTLMQALSQVTRTAVTEDSVAFLTSALEPAMDTGAMPFQNVHEMGLSMTRSMLQTSVRVQRVGDVTAQSLGKALSGIIEARSMQTLTRSAGAVDVYDDVHGLMTTLGTIRLQGRVPYEASLTIQSENFEHKVGRFSKEQLHERTTLTSSKCVAGACNAVVLPQSSPTLDVVDAQLLVWGTERRSTERELILSNVTSVQLLDGSKVLKSALETPLQVSMPLRASATANKERGDYFMPVCQYWDEVGGSWKSSGCIAVGSRVDSIQCECFHTTDFAGLFRSSLRDLGRSDLFLANDGKLIGREPHRMFVIVGVGSFCLLSVVLIFWGYYHDVGVSKSYAPTLRSSLFQRGYLHAATRRLEQRFRSLFLDLWSRRTAHLLQTRHAILGIFFRQPKDPYDRAARIACVSIHIVSCMCVNIVFLGAVGVPDASMLLVGVFTGLILIPVLPMCGMIFKAVAPAQRDRRKRSKKRMETRPKSPSKVAPLAPDDVIPVNIPAPRAASRRPRVEVAGTIEAVDNRRQGLDEVRPGPAPPLEPRPSAAMTPSRGNIDYDQLQEAVPRPFSMRGPHTPEVLSLSMQSLWRLLICVHVNDVTHSSVHAPCLQAFAVLPLHGWLGIRVVICLLCVSRSWASVGRGPRPRPSCRQLASSSQDHLIYLRSDRHS